MAKSYVPEFDRHSVKRSGWFERARRRRSVADRRFERKQGAPSKSDGNDATWIADLLAHGLISASFVAPEPIQELRDLTRIRKQLVREIVQHKQRVQKVLEDADTKLGSVV